jgi:hypothetical protein
MEQGKYMPPGDLWEMEREKYIPPGDRRERDREAALMKAQADKTNQRQPKPAPDGLLARMAGKLIGRFRDDPEWKFHTAQDLLFPFADNINDAYPGDKARIGGALAIDVAANLNPKIAILSWLPRQIISSKIKSRRLSELSKDKDGNAKTDD